MNSRLFPFFPFPPPETLGSHSPELHKRRPASVGMSAVEVVSPGSSNLTPSPSLGANLENSLIGMRREGWDELGRSLNDPIPKAENSELGASLHP